MSSLLRKMEDVKKEEMNSNTNVMYIHVCRVSCSIVVMFTCTLVRSHPDSRGRWVWNLNRCNKQQDTELGMATRCMLIGWGQNGLSLSPERGHKGRIREVLQEDRCSSMYSNYHALPSCIFMYSHIVLLFMHSGNLIRNTDWCLFFTG
jgi:hypothetical protein